MGKWSARVSDAIAFRRAGGRRRYHARRRRQAEARRREVWRWFLQWRHLSGVQGRLANTFRVSLATISRDLKYLRAAHAQDLLTCPTCGAETMVAEHPRVGRARPMANLPPAPPPGAAIAADRGGIGRPHHSGPPWRRPGPGTAMMCRRTYGREAAIRPNKLRP